MEAHKKKKIRVLFTRHLMEGHDIGLRTVVNKCKESGIEVIYYPRFNDLSEVVKVAQEEDANLIGLSSSSGAHVYLAKELISALREKDLDIQIIIGGVIPNKDIPRLKKLGVKGVFGPGSNPDEVASFILRVVESTVNTQA